MSFEAVDFHSPWFLLLIPVGWALVLGSRRRRRGAPSLVFPSIAGFRGIRPTWRQRAAFLVPLSQILAVVALVAAAARPRLGDSRTIIKSEGIAIQMILDRSSSMEEKMSFRANELKRIDIAKQVFEEFVAGDGDLAGRKSDLVGLTTFARYTEESCPLVSRHEPLLTAVKNLTTVSPAVDLYGRPVRLEDLPRRADRRKYRRNRLDGTAIGDGIRRAVYSLVTAEENLRRGEEEGGYKIQGKVIILLTDGRDNASEMDPVEAGKLAADNDIRLYYVLIGDTKEYATDFFGRRVIVGTRSESEILEVPRQIAGSEERAFLARDGDALRTIYEKIDRIERTEIGRIEYRSYDEKYHGFLLAGIGLLLLAVLLGETFLRRIP
ncbi:MAG: VWA domain-containing protein [Planctomycetota bacterium]|nr:VWA domain-containing protein [Planctomycetota bacterium]